MSSIVRPQGRRKQAARKPGRNAKQPRRVWARLLLLLYGGALVYWMFFGFGRTADPAGPLQYNLEPLRTIKLYIDLDNGVSYRGRLINLLGNIAVFIPFGILLPLIKPKMRSILHLTLAMGIFILILETLQMLLHVGSFDIDDLILNLLGVWLGYAILRIMRWH